MEGFRRTATGVRKNWSAYLFILPSFVLFAVFTLFPVAKGIQLSFMQYRVPPAVSTFAGLRNYREAFSSAIWLRAVGNTLQYAGYVVFGSIAVALCVAVMIFRFSNRVQGFYKCLFYLPGVTSAIIVASVWRWMFHPMYGLLNHVIGLMNMGPVMWLATPATAMPSIIFMDISKGDGAAILLILAALNGIPSSVFE
ncbi:MAG: sugar ABC transporter permease, partial [Clostridia bacterium]|nr:sugar ABC transporter permease [Clostridia bacterium]